MNFLKPGKNNREERIHFVEYWADYVRNTPDAVWSRQQKVLIDGQVAHARTSPLSPHDYLKLKGKTAHSSRAHV